MPESLSPGALDCSPSPELPPISGCPDDFSDDSLTSSRKRKAESSKDCSVKRWKDGSGCRTPLRVVPDAETNRQPASSICKNQASKNGADWSRNAKENECEETTQCVSAQCDDCSAVTAEKEIGDISAAGLESAPSNDQSSLLLSRETLDRSLCEESEAQNQEEDDAETFQFPDCGQHVALGTGPRSEDLTWHDCTRTGVWQLSYDVNDSVSPASAGLWGTLPLQGSFHCPAPIVGELAPGDQKILVLDMDETLIHASAQELPEVDFKVTDPFGMCASKISVKKRPHVEYFLEQVSKLFKVIIFTAGTKEYATQVLDQLDPTGTLFAHRLFREHCLLVGHLMVKDLRLVTSDLGQVIIVDNTPSAYLLQRENGIHIPSYFGMDSSDCELLHLLPFLESLATVEDVRPHIIRHATSPHPNQLQHESVLQADSVDQESDVTGPAESAS